MEKSRVDHLWWGQLAYVVLEEIQWTKGALWNISLAQERRNKEQSEAMEDITTFNISEVKYSSVKKLLRITDYTRRFIDKVRKKMNESENLPFQELMDAKVMRIKNLQEKPFLRDRKQLIIKCQRS